MSVSSYLLSRSPEIRVVCPASVLTWTVFTGMSSLPEGCMQGAETEPCWCELGRVGSWPPGSSAASQAAARAWSFSSAQAPTSRSPQILRTTLGDGIFRTKYP
jgi:hypothetical protein